MEGVADEGWGPASEYSTETFLLEDCSPGLDVGFVEVGIDLTAAFDEVEGGNCCVSWSASWKEVSVSIACLLHMKDPRTNDAAQCTCCEVCAREELNLLLRRGYSSLSLGSHCCAASKPICRCLGSGSGRMRTIDERGDFVSKQTTKVTAVRDMRAVSDGNSFEQRIPSSFRQFRSLIGNGDMQLYVTELFEAWTVRRKLVSGKCSLSFYENGK